MKKITSIMLCIVVALGLTGCSGKITEVRMRGARLNGYSEVPFVDFLHEYAEVSMREVFSDCDSVKYKIEYEEGWKTEHLNPNMLNNDERAVTYSLIFDAEEDGFAKRTTLRFYTIFYKETEMLDVRGLYVNSDGDIEEIFDREEIAECMEQMYSELYSSEDEAEEAPDEEVGV